MDFNNKFSANWYKNILSDQDINNKKQHIRNNLNTFIFPFSLKTGFINQTETGYKPSNATPSNYTQFTKALTGQEGLIAQWDNAIHISSLIVPNIFNWDTINQTKKSNDRIKINSIYARYKQYIKDNKLVNNLDTFLDWAGKFCFEQQTTIINVEEKYFKFINTTELDTHKEIKNYFVLIDSVVDDKGFFHYEDTFDNLIDSDRTQSVEHFLKKHEIDNRRSSKANTSLDYFLTKWYDKENASFFKGYLDVSEQESDFTDIPGASFMGDQQQWESVRRFSILTTEEVNKDLLFKLFMIPQHSNIGEKYGDDDLELFYINNSTSYYDNKGRQAYSLIQFASVNDSLATTGQTINSKVMFGAPGEGYAVPKLIYDKRTGKPIDFEINDKYTRDIGVNTIQIENYGVAGIMAPVIFGRPIENPGEVNEKIYPSRQLFLSDLKYNVPDPLSKQTNPESVFYYGTFTPEILSSYSDWKEKRRAEYTDSIVKKFDGWLDASYQSIVNSNSEGNSVKDWEVSLTNISKFDGRACSDIAVANDNRAIVNYQEATEFNLAVKGKLKPADLLNHGAVLYKPLTTLPISTVQTTPWSLGDIPLIGSFLSKITLGIPIGWRYVSNKGTGNFPPFSYINMFLSAPMFKWYTLSFWNVEDEKNAKGRIPFDPFKHSTNDSVGGLIDNSSQSTVLCGNITDKIKTNYWDFDKNAKSSEQIVVSTVYLGSKLNYDKKQENKQPYWNVDTIAVDKRTKTDYIDYETKNETRYIIDAIGEFAVGKCPVKLTTFLADPDISNPYANINWQATLKSKAMYTDNIRDIQTVYKTSYIDEFIDSDIVATFPPLPNPPFPKFDIPDKVININYYNPNYDVGTEGKVWLYKHSNKHYWGIDQTVAKNGFIVNWNHDTVLTYKDDGTLKHGYYETVNTYPINNELIFDFSSLGYHSLEEVFLYYSSIDIDLKFEIKGYSFQQSGSDWDAGYKHLNNFSTENLNIKTSLFSGENYSIIDKGTYYIEVFAGHIEKSVDWSFVIEGAKIKFNYAMTEQGVVRTDVYGAVTSYDIGIKQLGTFTGTIKLNGVKK